MLTMLHRSKSRKIETSSHTTLVTHFILQREKSFHYIHVRVYFRNNFKPRGRFYLNLVGKSRVFKPIQLYTR